MRLWKVLAAAVLMMAVMSLPAQALTITPDDAKLSGNQNNTPSILAYLSGLGYDMNELYKSEVDNGSESGSFANSYNTTYTPRSDPYAATITYSGGPVITGNPIYLLVKDGKTEPAWYFFNLTASAWNGTETVTLSSFWPGDGAISHVSIHGTAASVPDGGSAAMLLGMALLALAGSRRLLA